MQNLAKHDLQTAAIGTDSGFDPDTELSILKDVFRMLPAGVTVQDEQGRFLLVNDAAAAQLGIAAGEPIRPTSHQMIRRRETGLELLRSFSAAVSEECVGSGEIKQVIDFR